MKASQALNEIFNEFENLRIYNQENMYTVEKYGTINLIRITDIGKEFLAEEEQKQEEQLTGHQERILIEVLGVDRPNLDYFLSLKQIIEKQIQQKTMSMIASYCMRNRFMMQQSDIDYLHS